MQFSLRSIVILTIIFACSCSSGSADLVKVDLPAKPEINGPDTIRKTSDTIIIREKEWEDTLVKYIAPAFADYSVQVSNMKFDKKLDFSGYEWKRMFRTSTRRDVEEKGVNFAGHYCFAFWGCGSNCKISAVVDLKTGKVYNGINAQCYSFERDSRLLIVNPPDSGNWYNIGVLYAIPEAYEWTGKNFRKIEK